MKIGLDVRVFLKQETGIGVYFHNMVKHLIQLPADTRYCLFSASWKDRFHRALPPKPNYIIRDRKIPGSLLEFLWYRLSALSFRTLTGFRPDLVHSPLPVVIPGRHRHIITVHDLCLMDHPHLVHKETLRHFKKRLSLNLARADGIIAVSKFTRDRLLSHFGSNLQTKTRVIYHGTDFPGITPRRPASSPSKDYYLFVGSVEPRKNLPTLLKAIAILKSRGLRIRLVIAGKKAWGVSECFDLIRDLGLETQVVFLEYLERPELKFLYQHARALIFPSFYEGFGLPVLEAFSVGLPVISSDLAVFREIFQDYPLYFNPRDPEQLAGLISELEHTPDRFWNRALTTEAIRKNCQWELAARKTHTFYRDLIS